MLGAVVRTGPAFNTVDGQAMSAKVFNRQERGFITSLVLAINRQHNRYVDMPRAASGTPLAVRASNQFVYSDRCDGFRPHGNLPPVSLVPVYWFPGRKYTPFQQRMGFTPQYVLKCGVTFFAGI